MHGGGDEKVARIVVVGAANDATLVMPRHDITRSNATRATDLRLRSIEYLQYYQYLSRSCSPLLFRVEADGEKE